MNSIPMLDAVVVGGGPAGATAAYCLAKAGQRVRIIDKHVFPRSKLCAGLITRKTTECLRRLFGISIRQMKDAGLIRNTLYAYRIYHRRTEIVRGRLDHPFHLVDRQHYDHYLLKRALDAGAELTMGRTVTAVRPKQGKVYLEGGHFIKARAVIGADGVWSCVRRSIFPSNQDRRRWRSCLAMTIEKVCPVERPESHASLHFGYVPWGYAWSFPLSGQRIVGIGSLRHKDGRPFSEGFGGFMKDVGLASEAVPPWRGHPLPFGNYLSRPGCHRVLLTGDACGLADPLLGEGIYYAHRSAELAADAVLSSSADGHLMNRRYRKALDRNILRELRWIRLYRDLLFLGGRIRRYRGLKTIFRLIPKRLEAAIHGDRTFGRLLLP